jgi:rod shape-determining protein MreD
LTAWISCSLLRTSEHSDWTQASPDPMAYLVGIPLLILLAIVQSTFLGTFRFLDGRPDLLLLAVVGWGLAGGKTETMVWGLFAGFLIDLLSGLPFGASAVALVFIGYMVTLFERRVWEANFIMPLGVTLVASFAFHIWNVGVIILMGRPFELNFALSRVILPSIFLNLILALPAVQLLTNLRGRLYPAEVDI